MLRTHVRGGISRLKFVTWNLRWHHQERANCCLYIKKITIPSHNPSFLFMFVLSDKIVDYKRRLFDNLSGKAEKVLDICVATGPNLKYYSDNENAYVLGMDPNHKMEQYACEPAREARLKPENFRFMQVLSVTDLFSCYL